MIRINLIRDEVGSEDKNSLFLLRYEPVRNSTPSGVIKCEIEFIISLARNPIDKPTQKSPRFPYLRPVKETYLL